MRDPVRVFVSEEAKPFRLLRQGHVVWGEDRLIIEGDAGQPMHFMFRKLDGLNIHFHHKLDFFYEDKLYRLEFYEPRTSAYKWLKMVQIAMSGSETAPDR